MGLLREIVIDCPNRYTRDRAECLVSKESIVRREGARVLVIKAAALVNAVNSITDDGFFFRLQII